MAVGTNGADISLDGGATWKRSSSLDLNAVATDGEGTVWAVGPRGTVARLSLEP
jgi:hypothetical protein